VDLTAIALATLNEGRPTPYLPGDITAAVAQDQATYDGLGRPVGPATSKIKVTFRDTGHTVYMPLPAAAEEALPAEQGGTAPPEDLAGLSHRELVALAKARGLKAGGTKAALIERLEQE